MTDTCTADGVASISSSLLFISPTAHLARLRLLLPWCICIASLPPTMAWPLTTILALHLQDCLLTHRQTVFPLFNVLSSQNSKSQCRNVYFPFSETPCDPTL